MSDDSNNGARPHKLTWSGKEWVAPCGCAYHPDDDKGSHGGAPHVHLCKAHEESRIGVCRYGASCQAKTLPGRFLCQGHAE